MSEDVSYYLKGFNNLIDRTGNNKTFYPYTKQYIQYLSDLGIDTGSTFYYFKGYLTEAEQDGAYRYPEVK